jgi:hypothetical protein
VDGAELLKTADGGAKLAVRFPAGAPDEYRQAKIVVRFSTKQSKSTREKR